MTSPGRLCLFMFKKSPGRRFLFVFISSLVYLFASHFNSAQISEREVLVIINFILLVHKLT